MDDIDWVDVPAPDSVVVHDDGDTSAPQPPDVTRNASENGWLWCADYDSPSCLRCCRRFKKLRVHRHHCQCCGLAVCGECSDQRLPTLPLLRVCFICYNDNMRRYDVALQSGVRSRSEVAPTSSLSNGPTGARPSNAQSMQNPLREFLHDPRVTPQPSCVADPAKGKFSDAAAWEVIDYVDPATTAWEETSPNRAVGAGPMTLLQMRPRSRAVIANRGVLRTRTQGLLAAVTGWKKRCFVLDSNGMLACFTQYTCDADGRVHVSDRFPSAIINMCTVQQLCLAGGLCLGCGEPCVRLDRIRPSATATSVLQPSETAATSPPTHCPPASEDPVVVMVELLPRIGRIYHPACFKCNRRACSKDLTSNPHIVVADGCVWCAESTDDSMDISCYALQSRLLKHSGLLGTQPTQRTMSLSRKKILKKKDSVVLFEDKLDIPRGAHMLQLDHGSLQEVSAAGSDVFCGSTEEHHRSAPSGGNSAGTPQGIDHVCVDGVCDPRAVTACGAYAGNGRDTNNSEGCGSDCSVSDSSGSDSSGSVVSWQFVTTNEVSALYKRWAQCPLENAAKSVSVQHTRHTPNAMSTSSTTPGPPVKPAVPKVGRRKLISADAFWRAASHGITQAIQSLNTADTGAPTRTHTITDNVTAPVNFVEHLPFRFDMLRRSIGVPPAQFVTSFSDRRAPDPGPCLEDDVDNDTNTHAEHGVTAPHAELEDLHIETDASHVAGDCSHGVSHELDDGSHGEDDDVHARDRSASMVSGSSADCTFGLTYDTDQSSRSDCNQAPVNGGRSGSFMMVTPDSRFIVKTIPSGELNVLRNILESYIDHTTRHPHTLLVRVCGLYELHVSHVRLGRTIRDKVSFMIMKNVLDTGQSVSMHRVYDLKGSAVNRRSVVWKQSGVAAQFDPGVTLKDMDLRQPLQLGAATSDVIRQLETDANFLSSLGIMDYSLLVGVHECDDATAASCDRIFGSSANEQQTVIGQSVFYGYCSPVGTGNTVVAVDSPHVPRRRALYALGVIDILQEWSKSKEAEAFLKSTILRNDRIGISAVNPKTYAERFVSAMSTKFDVDI